MQLQLTSLLTYYSHGSSWILASMGCDSVLLNKFCIFNKTCTHNYMDSHFWLYHIPCGDGAWLVPGELSASRAAVIPVSIVPPVRCMHIILYMYI